MARHWQLLLAAIWLGVAGFLMLGEPRWWLGIAVALMFTVWNLVRWWTQRKPRPIPPPPPRKGPTEYNPQFDFQQMEDRASPG